MWIMTKTGFLSIVQKPDDKDTLTVRARAKGQIESIFPTAKVTSGQGTDYLYRAKIDRTDVATVIYEQIMATNYSNFKGAVKDNALHDAYMGCWSVMMRYQTQQPEPERTCEQGCNGCDECTDYDDSHDEPECQRCHGDGMDPWNDYLLTCPLCIGDKL